MKKIKTLFLFVFTAVELQLYAQTTNHQVYAVFVVSIAKYSSWPEADTKDFKIMVLGKSKVYDELTKATANKDIHGKKIIVNQTDDIQNVVDAQIVYLPDGKSNQLGELLKLLSGKSVMIIAEREGLFKKGAHFSFVVLDNNTLRFDINKKESESHQIKISQSLSSL
ncbi:MAG TPA: YfiR family protein, partial [Cyclobacteriaceae bacterium]|nr:YfiR family protein [Cyclobacteriaceae bacterium]